jgi:hypothetical protein
MTINTLIKELGQNFNIPELTLDKNACAIQFKNGVQIDFYYKEEDKSLRMATAIGALISSSKLSLYKKILFENAQNSDLGKNYFALNLAATEVVLCSTIIESAQTLDGVTADVMKLCEQQNKWCDALSSEGFLVF